jgi:hypothetical protein
MCYEVFNRSAADTYLKAMKRERLESQDAAEAASSPVVRETLQELQGTVKNVDWAGLGERLFPLLRKLWPVFLIGAGLIAGGMTIRFLVRPALWYHLLGKKLSYAFPENDSLAFRVGMTEKIRSWSERDGRLDTPLEEFQVEELGNVFLAPEKSSAKDLAAARLRVKEWIQVVHDARRPAGSGMSLSHTIPLNHPSLADAHLTLDKKGFLMERPSSGALRTGKAAVFLAPLFPTHRLRRGEEWTERIEWTDIFNDWKIHWAGTRRWAVGELEPCDGGNCLRLTYQADVQPQLWASPGWAAKAGRQIEPQMSAEGVVLFDAAHQRLASSTFSYDGILRIPTQDLGRIPRELRVGRRVKKTPGDIVIRFENIIDLHRN